MLPSNAATVLTLESDAMIKKIFTAVFLAGSVALAAENPVVAQKADYPCRESRNFKFRGNPDDWRSRGALPLFLNGSENRVIPDWRGPDDVEATVYLLYDSANLYLAGLVRDASFVKQESSGQLYRGSGFQAAFDPLDDTLLPGYDGNDVEIGFGKLADGRDVAHCWVAGMTGSSGEAGDVKVKVTELGKGIQFYEAAIPWSRLVPFDPAKQDHFGFNILYNANDGRERRGWLHWTPGIGEEKLAFMFRNVRLVPAGTGKSEPTISTDRSQYSSGDPVIISVCLPTDTKTSLSAQLDILDGEKVIHTEKKNVQAEPGGTELRFRYETGRLRGHGLDARVTAAWKGETVELSAEILNLSAEILKKRSAELKAKNTEFRARLAAAASRGIPIDYPLVAAAVCDITLKHRDTDLADPARLRKFALPAKINRQFRYLDRSLDLAEAELKALEKDQKLHRPVPKVSVDNLRVRDGAFYSGDDPVILIGPHGWWEVYPDIDLIADAGFNLIGGTLIVQDAVPAPGKKRTDFGNTILRHIKNMHRRNLAYDFLISPHPIPEAWKKAFPEMERYRASGWVGSSFYVPATRQMIEEMWAVLLPIVRNEPNLVSLNLVNEWSFSDGFRGDVHPKMRERFLAAMQEKYASVEQLNRKWKSAYKSFDEIDPAVLKRGTTGGFYDWECFRYAEGLENVDFLRATAEKYAPGKLRQIKTIAVTDLNPEQYTPVGVEREERGELMDIVGSDCAATIHLDYYRSMVPGKPAADTEFHVSSGIKPEEIVTDCWSAVLHGEGMREYFAWANSYSAEMQVAGAMLHIPEALEALGRSVLDIRRLTPEIVRFQQQIPEAEVGILYSPASLYCDKGYPSSLRQYHTMLSNLDTPIRFISERQLEGDKFGKIKLIVIPKAAFIPAGTVDALRRFTKQGGKIAAAEGALQNDPYGDPLPPLETMWKLDDKTLNPVVLDRLLTESGISRPVRLKGVRPGQVELRSIRTAPDEYLFYAINYGPAAKVQPELEGKLLNSAMELIAGSEIRFPFELNSRQPVMFRVKK